MFKVYIVPVGPSNVAPIVRWQTRGGDIWNIWRQAAQASMMRNAAVLIYRAVRLLDLEASRPVKRTEVEPAAKK